MTTQPEECACDALEMTQIAMPSEAFQLCHHSDPELIAQARDRYGELIARLASGLNPILITEAPISEASSYYARERLTPQQRHMATEQQMSIVHSAFLRTKAALVTYQMLEQLLQAALLTHDPTRPPDQANQDQPPQQNDPA